MADEVSKHPGPFDVLTIKALVSLMSKHDISEIDLREGPQRILLRRGTTVTTVALPPPSDQGVSGTRIQEGQSSEPQESDKRPSRNLLEIKSPAIGTFYDREKPEAQPYVSIGSRVTPKTTVGQLEAMKVFSEIPAGCSGVIVEILVEQGKPVEYNQVLFRVDPSR